VFYRLQVSISPPTYDRNSGNSLRSSPPPKLAVDLSPSPGVHYYSPHQDNDNPAPDGEFSGGQNNVQTATASSAKAAIASPSLPSHPPSSSGSVSQSETSTSSISETSSPSPSKSAARSREVVLESLVKQRSRPKRHGGMNIVAPPLDPSSSKTCLMIGSWSETCVYRNMCYDTENWYLIRNDVDPNLSIDDQEPFYPYNDFKTGVVYPETPIPPVGRDFFPYQDGGND
jgi:hypothetical protein